jgi:transposase-like protein
LVDTPETERMSTMGEKRRKYTKELVLEAVRLVRRGDKSLAQVGRDLGISETTLSGFVHRADMAEGKGKSAPEPEKLTPPESEELRQLRRENAVLREEREILKKAAAFFAKENK